DKLTELNVAKTIYQAIAISRTEIETRLPAIIAFAKTAMEHPNYYLWGGTVGPNYDCSGLMQTAFAASGIWLPRNSDRQADFTQPITREELLPGDLIFFGQEKVNHVALYLEAGYYLHSSGKDMGRNGIGIDRLSEQGDEISRSYYQKLWGFGRVISNHKY
ncbi:MAG: C40 family peptidase, partial [Microcystaceae cyanobacterium]